VINKSYIENPQILGATVQSLWPGSSDGIAADYGLDGPGIESRWGRDFSHTPQPAVHWVPGLSRG
jgi:hypothetical protein